ncbi:hypothetical protein GCM10020331_065220 [Ectobacillus funiculus]
MYIEQRIQPRKALQHIQPYHPGKKFMVLQVFGLVFGAAPESIIQSILKSKKNHLM